ncbi:MAG: prephenate dehydratase [Planctomycetes bacterium]|jgi:chorismate mutase/prephenate dehydratase|nr:prephenate dehydratase [Planctomycetota bacterium]
MSEDKALQNMDLQSLRERIDQLDRQIVELLSQRAEVVVEVGRAKQTDGTPIYAADREQKVLQRIAEFNPGPLPQKTLQAIYRELMSGSFALEKPLRIGFLGPEGTFSHMASMRKFGASVEHHALPDIRAVFDEVARGHCDLGLVPVENSLGGGVIETMDCFLDHDVRICAEVVVEIHHNLLANCPAEDVRLVASKPVVFAQCRNWLSTGLSNVDLIPVASTSKAAEMAVSESNLAAIGSDLAAELYGLKVVFANIEDNPNNQTRFLAIGRQTPGRTGEDKTSMIFTTAHKSGALVEVLNVLARHEVNLTNIGSRPSKRRNWEYYFFVDVEGHQQDAALASAIKEACEHCGELHILGSYPRATGPI